MPPAADKKPMHEAELIFPPKPKHSHGSSIVETPKGSLLAVWFHGSGERTADDVMIQGARKRKGEEEWCEPFLAADSQNLPDCNPALFMDPRGTLWLFWIAVLDNDWGGSLLKYRTSTDYEGDGPPKWEWQDVIHCRIKNLEEMYIQALEKAERELAERIESHPGLKRDMSESRKKVKAKLSCRLGWMTRLHPIMISKRRMMLGLYSDVFNCSVAAFTEDWGGSWDFSHPIIGFGNIQPSFVMKTNGDIVAMMRENGVTRRIRHSVSKDGGMTWSLVQCMKIPNTGSSVECIVLDNGNWLLICNDTTKGRHSLAVYLSEDEGRTWKWKRHLELWKPDKGSASYPSLVQAEDGTFHCTYSYRDSGIRGASIKHAHFNEAWIKQGD